MNGKYLLGVLSGGVLVIGGLVVGAALFPPDAPAPINTPQAAVEAAAQPVPAPAMQPEPPPETDTPAALETDPAPELPPEDPQDPATGQVPDVEAAAPEVDDAATTADGPAEKVASETASATVTDDAAVSAAVDPAPLPESASAGPTPATEPEPELAPLSEPVQPSLADLAADPEIPAASANQIEAGADPSPLAEVAEPAALTLPLALPRLETDAVLAALDSAAVAAPERVQQPAGVVAGVAGGTGTQAEVAIAEATPEPRPEVTQEPAAPEIAEAMPLPDSDEREGTETAELTEEPLPATPYSEAAPDKLAPAPVADPEVALLPEAGENAAIEDEASAPTFKAAPGFGYKAEGVVVRRLPRIGDAPAIEVPDAGDDVAEAGQADMRPIAIHAASFENLDNKPVMAIVLIDTGEANLDRAGIAALPFPVSIALDPLDPASKAYAAIYREQGKEVVMLATGIADGALASDIEVAFQSMDQGLPQAVAVMDLAQSVFQQRRPLAGLVVPVIGAQGRGLLTWDQGLNAADQVARREDIPAAVVFRDLAAAGEDRAAIRRILDRAVFKAGQDGRVTVAGNAAPETLAALLEWSVEGRGATVTLAPLTAVLTVN